MSSCRSTGSRRGIGSACVLGAQHGVQRFPGVTGGICGMLDASHQARDSRGTAETWIAIRGAAFAAILSTPAHAPCPGLGQSSSRS